MLHGCTWRREMFEMFETIDKKVDAMELWCGTKLEADVHDDTRIAGAGLLHVKSTVSDFGHSKIGRNPVHISFTSAGDSVHYPRT